MEPLQILRILEEYFIDYFGKEYKALITRRLGKTKFSFVNEDTVKKAAEELIKSINIFCLKNGIELLNEENKFFIVKYINAVVTLDGLRGVCGFWVGDKNGSTIDVRRGAYVKDYKYTAAEKTIRDAFTDITVCHELLHAVTQHVCNNKLESGIENAADRKAVEMNEWIINNIALELTEKLHSDGVVFNERIKPSKEIYNAYRDADSKLRRLPANFFSNYKSVLKPAMLTGNFDELHHAFGGKKRFTEECMYVDSLC